MFTVKIAFLLGALYLLNIFDCCDFHGVNTWFLNSGNSVWQKRLNLF